MKDNDLAAYYEKLSEIRSRVLNKHRDSSTKSFSKYNKQNLHARPYPEDRYKDQQNSHFRKVLEDKDEKETNVLDRVKELDSVNEKIKLILASKRQPYSSASNQRVHSSYRRSLQTSITPKKMTSLFQNQKNIVQSKVVPQTTWAKSKEKRTYEPEFKISNDKSISADGQFESFKFRGSEKQNISIEEDMDLPKSSRYYQTIFTSANNTPLSNQRDTFSFNVKQSDIDPPQTAKFPYSSQGTRAQVSGYISKPVTKRLIQVIVKQIELDAKLREVKQKYHNYKSPDKLNILKHKLITYGINLAGKQIEEWISMSTQEYNPFLEIAQQSSFDFDELTTRIIASWTYWNNHVKESATITGLENEGFTVQEIDLSGKGFITIEDFVCFINLNSDSSFRNRDVFNMFRRWNHATTDFKLQNKLEYENFLNFISK